MDTENLSFSLNATVPVFLMMVLGYFLHRTPLLDDNFANKLNNFVFKAALPVQLFKNLAESDFYTVWDGSMVLFCFVVSLASILIMLGLSFTLRDRSLRAEFTQAGYRSSQALMGAALLENIYGTTGPLALILIGAVPLYNVAAVTMLTLMGPEGGRLDRKTILKALKGIVTNPIILGIVVGLLWALLEIPQPVIFRRAVEEFSATATPLGLIALGASIDLKKAVGCLKPTLVCSTFKLVVFVALFLPLAILLGCRGELLVAMLVMLGSPTTVSCFSMARSMGHEGVLTSSTVMLTTIFSAFTFTGWLYLLKCFGLV
ncbi:MAG: AEC family transporter [Oscillospiraceae bacterium]|nr:AEC family transporter [Oscillospiraceae bacterium]MCC8090720.1 AEC family transporter [Oscillospiraceae bacterium]MCC8156144.1 AEC family transporter [Oscillospiraceae bacterium]